MKGTLRVGLLGLGTVGTGVAEMLSANCDLISDRTGVQIVPAKAAVKNKSKLRSIALPLAESALALAADPEIDVIVEVMGGMSPAEEAIRIALESGKHVVTANKELIARKGASLLTLAEDRDLDLLFEASVCGGIPIINALKNQLCGNQLRKLTGIINGTTNYILTRMHAGCEYEQALAEAQQQGYAEADPTADVQNYDAQSKCAILSSIAFGCSMPPDCLYREGIAHVTLRDAECASILGYTIKSVAIAQEVGGRVDARVHPLLVKNDNPLAKVDGAYNAILVQGDFVGELMLLGAGAGKNATASSVVGDLIEIARNRVAGSHARISHTAGEQKQVLPIEDTVNRYYVRVTSEDRPKALGQIALAFGENNVSLAGLEMHELPDNKSELVFLTHAAKDGDVRSALGNIEKLPMIQRVDNCLRVENS